MEAQEELERQKVVYKRIALSIHPITVSLGSKWLKAGFTYISERAAIMD